MKTIANILFGTHLLSARSVGKGLLPEITLFLLLVAIGRCWRGVMIQRFDLYGDSFDTCEMKDHNGGDYVLYSDHREEVERLTLGIKKIRNNLYDPIVAGDIIYKLIGAT
jgi:hypothetical protein